MPRMKRSARQDQRISYPPPYRAKPLQSMTVGWQYSFPTGTSSGGLTAAVDYADLMFAVAAAGGTVAAATATMHSLFQSVRIRRVEAWGLNGVPITISWSSGPSAGIYVPGPDSTVTDSGTSVRPSHVVLKPQKGSIQDNWYQFNSTASNLCVLTINNLAANAAAGSAVLVILRCKFDFVLNDALAYSTAFSTSNVNTVTGGLLYWRILVTSGNNWFPESSPALGQYFP